MTETTAPQHRAPGLEPIVYELRQFHQDGLKRIGERHRSGAGGMQIVDETTGLMDQIVMRVWQYALREGEKSSKSDLSSVPPRVSLVAIGGYGRAQLHPKSDVDLLFLHKRVLTDLEAQLIKTTLRVLWDLGLDLGHSVRTITDCIRVAGTDLDTQTALLENRYLAGNRQLYEQFHMRYRKFIAGRGIQKFVLSKEESRQDRYHRYGEVVAVQEPNVKEGAGGLRDLHHAIWLSLAVHDISTLAGIRRHGLVREPFYSELQKAVDFILRIRNELHITQRANSNKLTFDVQESIAKSFRYSDEGVSLAEEKLMRDYYTAAACIQQFADHMTNECLRTAPWLSIRSYFRRKRYDDGFTIQDGILSVKEPETFFLNRPLRILRVFEIVQETACALDSTLQVEIARNLSSMDEQDFARSKEAGEMIISMFSQRGRVGPALRCFYETGFLDVLIPEFSVIRFLPRRDLYHRFTVDEHSILTVEILDGLAKDHAPVAPCLELEELSTRFPGARRKWRWWGTESITHWASETEPKRTKDSMSLPLYSQTGEKIVQDIRDLYNQVEEPALLYLATFLHDIGKGRGGDHHVKGAAIACEVCRRLGLNDPDTDLVIFLVEKHLEFAKIAFRFDTQDFTTVQEFASWCDTRLKLDYLYLLTLADIWAVNTDLLTEWKLAMLHQFYSEVRAFLDDREAVEAKRLEEQKQAYSKFLAELPRDLSETEAERHVVRMPIDYLLKQNPDTVHHQMRILRKYTGEQPVVGCRQTLPNILEVVTMQPSRIGNFMRTARSLSSLGLSITEARIFVRDDGVAFNTLMVEHSEGSEFGEDMVRRVVERTTDSLQDRWDPQWDPRKKIGAETGRYRFDPEVQVLNGVSPRYTVVEVRCADAIGVLVTITTVLAKYGLNINFARIHTEGQRVFDTFYVLDGDRRKFEEPQKINWFKNSLIKALNELGG